MPEPAQPMAKTKKKLKAAVKAKSKTPAKAKVQAKKAIKAKPAAKKVLKKAAVKSALKAAAKPVKPQPQAKAPKAQVKKAKEVLKGKVPQAPESGKKGKAAKVTVEEVEIIEVSLEVPAEETVEEIVLTDAEGRRYCRTRDCDQLATVDGYCRYHYLLFWKRIQVRKKILAEGKLERYVEELTARYPDKFLEILKRDLKSEKDFLAAIQELEIDEAASSEEGEFEDEAQSYIEEVRGISDTVTTREEEDF